MVDGVIEVITGRERRRRWNLEENLRIVAETLEPGGSVQQVAAQYDHWTASSRSSILCFGAPPGL
jgi:transposase-like protein